MFEEPSVEECRILLGHSGIDAVEGVQGLDGEIQIGLVVVSMSKLFHSLCERVDV